MKKFLSLVAVLMLSACTGGPPGGLQIVQNFDLQRYQGEWFEIARLDHRFERGLSQVSANYSAQDDNSVRVTNMGFDENSQEWEEAIGRAKLVAAVYSRLVEIAATAGFAVDELIMVEHSPGG